MTDLATRELKYKVVVEQCWSASCVSPITGKPLLVYGTTVEESRQLLDFAIWKEAKDLGCDVTRWDGVKVATSD